MQLLPEELQLGLQLASGYLLYPLPGSLSWSPLEELVHHGQVFLQEESGAEEEALELERLATSARRTRPRSWPPPECVPRERNQRR